MMVAPHIECEDVWKVFGTHPNSVLERIRHERLDKDAAQARFGAVIGVAGASFTVNRGEILCIMGLSGSGKSTLLRHINRLIEPTSGSIKIDGQDIAKFSAKELRNLRSKHLGMVFQHMALWPHRTVRDNVAFGLEVRGVERSERAAASLRALSRVNLSAWADRYPDELSGGMQQRVGLARALAADPEVLLMDEPFSALDPIVRAELQNEFRELATSLKKTTIFITHDLEEAVKLGDRVAIMKDGAIVQIAPPAELLAKPANDYVARFVQGISRLRHLTCREFMEASDGCPLAGTQASRTISVESDLSTALDQLLLEGGPLSVRVGEKICGQITLRSTMEAVRKCLN